MSALLLTWSQAAELYWPCPGFFGKKHFFDKQEVISVVIERRNDRTEWQNKELAVVSLELTEISSGSHLSYLPPFLDQLISSSWKVKSFCPVA